MPFKSNFFCEKGASRNQDPFKSNVATGSEKDLIFLDEQHGTVVGIISSCQLVHPGAYLLGQMKSVQNSIKEQRTT